MVKALSLDLRVRVLKAVSEGASHRVVAERFGVSAASVSRWRALARTQGVELPGRSVPGWLARGLAALVEGIWRALGIARTPPMTRFAISMMSSEVTVDTARARAELGYSPVMSVEAGLEALRAQGRGSGSTRS